MRKVAIVTGASSGIGRQLCLELAKEGYDLGLLARSQAALETLAAEIRQLGQTAVVCPCDVSQKQSVFQAVERVHQEFGGVDLLVANAGIGRDQSLKTFDAGQARKIYEVNVIGLMQSIAAVLPQMIQQGRGHIVGISSIAAFISFPKTYVYCASKAAVNAHLEGLRIEAKGYGIDVTTVCPGFIKTPLTAKNKFKMPFLMDVEKAAKIISKGIRKKKSMLIFPKALYLLMLLGRYLPTGLRKI